MSMEELKYRYSQLSSESVGRLVASHYNIDEVNHCEFYVRGLHDNYLIKDNDETFILRIYRNDWRSRDEILFELELLAFLRDNNSPVAYPLQTKSGGLCFFIKSPEGERAAALFPYADGCAPGNKITVAESALLGNTIAELHNITETFKPNHSRIFLNITHLLDESILAIQPFVDKKVYSYLCMLQNEIKDNLPKLSQESPVYGICMGDVNPTNFHINNNDIITLFDFDQCGYGYRAFEIGKFISSIQSVEAKGDIADAFIDGYQQVRHLTQDELHAIPHFVKISRIWVMAIHVYNASHIGYKWLEKPFWDRHIALLQAMD